MFEKLFGKKESTYEKNKDKTLQVIKSRCPQNHACPSVPVCPVDALTQSGYDAPKVNQEKCIKCAKCVRFCPRRALVLK